jgi:hypothetical protein
MKILRSLACLALLAAPAAPLAMHPAAAQTAPGESAPDAEALAAARDLSKETMRQMMPSFIGGEWPGIANRLRAKQPNITAEQVADLRGEYERILLDYMNNAMADAPALYARYFTAAELREMLAYNRSPLGQKALRIMPLLSLELFQMIVPKLQQAEGQMLDAFTKVARQKGFNL